ncbi:hypothetical protein ANCCEY_08292, partial [Ancylostoma ceylanicum]
LFAGAICYIELGTSILEPGCDFAYTVYVGWEAIAFAFMWVSVFVTYPASAAVQARTFGQYIGWTQNLENPMAGSVWAPGKLTLAFYGGLWSYAGWDILNYGTPEISKPRRTMPLSLISGILIVCATYAAINVSYFVVLSPEEMKNSTAVAADFAQKTLGNFSYAIPFMVAILLIGTLNSNIFCGSRFMHAAAREGHLPTCISCVNEESNSPRAALLGQASAIKVPIWLTVVFMVLSLALVLVPFVEEPVVTITGVAVVFSGLIFFFALVKPDTAPTILQRINEAMTRITCRLLYSRPDLKKGIREIVKHSDEIRGLGTAAAS